MRYLLAVLCAAAILVGQYFYGGGAGLRPVFAFPSYLVLGVAGLLAIPQLWARRAGGSGACLLAMGTFLGWLAWRTVHTPDLWLEQSYLMLILACGVIYLLCGWCVTTTESRLLFIGILLLGGLVQSAVAAAQFAGVLQVMPQGWSSEQFRLWYEARLLPANYHRAHGLYLNANHLAWFLNAMAFFALALGIFGRGSAWTKVLAIYLAAVLLVADSLCLSRGGVIAMAAGLAVFLLLSALAIGIGAGGRRKVMLALLLGGLLIPVGILLFANDKNAAFQARMEIIASDGYRARLAGFALEQAQISPLLGTGAGTFQYLSRETRLWGDSSDPYFAHDDWIQLAADFGLPAALLFLLAVVLHLFKGAGAFVDALRKRMAQSHLPQSNSVALFLGAISGTVAFAVHSTFDFNLQVPSNALLAAGLAGLLVAAEGGQGREQKSLLRLPRFVHAAGVVATVIAGMGLLMVTWRSRAEINWLSAENALLRSNLPSVQAEIAEGLRILPDHPRLLRMQADLGKRMASRMDRTAQARQIAALERIARVAPLDRAPRVLLAQAYGMAGSGATHLTAVESIEMGAGEARGYEFCGSLAELNGDPSMAARFYRVASVLSNPTIAAERLSVLEAAEKKRLESR